MISLLSEYELVFGMLPDEPDSSRVIYIESHKNEWLEGYIRTHLDLVKGIFSRRGLEFLYLPEMVDDLTDERLADAVRYCAPWYKPTDLEGLRNALKVSVERLYETVNLKDGASAVVNRQGRAFKVEVKDSNPDLLYVLFDQMAEAYARGERQTDGGIRFRVSEPKVHHYLDELGKEAMEHYFAEEAPTYQTLSPIDDEYSNINTLWEQVKQKRPTRELEAMLKAMLQDDKVISTVVIDNPRTLKLPEYNMEIRMAPATMAFYLLFLKHPEGIRFKELIGHRDELYKLYAFTTKSGNKAAIARTVDVMVSQLDGNQDIQRSRIKSAIRKSIEARFSEYLARWYYLDGKRGDLMKVAVAGEPGKVIWKVDP